MPKMQVYLPDELHAAVKANRLGASKLLQDAVRAELRRRTLVEEGRKYVDEIDKRRGTPSRRERAAAGQWVENLLEGGRKRTRRSA
jgi:post-segregation antitoxin (ccd killing protein)